MISGRHALCVALSLCTVSTNRDDYPFSNLFHPTCFLDFAFPRPVFHLPSNELKNLNGWDFNQYNTS